MPVGTSWVVGASGNDNTCTAQGFLYDWTYVAFPFYYASFSVLALVSVKNNFKEEKYAWIEKWIHLGAYIPPLIFSIFATVRGWMKPGAFICSFRYYLMVTERNRAHRIWHVSHHAISLLASNIYAPFSPHLISSLSSGTGHRSGDPVNRIIGSHSYNSVPLV